VYEEESSTLAAELLRDLCRREGIESKQLILHSDNGSPMKGATMLYLATTRWDALIEQTGGE
jgi:transposase InsO family protein